MKEKALVPAHFLESLRERCADLGVEPVPYDSDGRPLADSGGASVLFRWWLSVEQGDALLEQHPSIRWVHSGSAGVDHILTARLLASNVILTNSAGVHAPSIAEWVVASMLYFEKDLGSIIEQQRARIWQKVERPELSSRSITIVGAGRIASEIAVRLRPFGPRLTAIRHSSDQHPLFDQSLPVSELTRIAPASDWLIVAVPLTSKTRHLIDRNILQRLPASSRLVNVGRGEIVDERALIEALTETRVAGAVLDVLEEEPPAADHPLWSMPQVLLLPHTTWRSPEVKGRQRELFLENLRRFIEGEALCNVVDVDRGY